MCTLLRARTLYMHEDMVRTNQCHTYGTTIYHMHTDEVLIIEWHATLRNIIEHEKERPESFERRCNIMLLESLLNSM